MPDSFSVRNGSPAQPMKGAAMSPRSAQYLLTTLITLLLVSCSRQDPLAESQKLIQQFDYVGARTILERVIAKDSTNVEAMAMLLRTMWLENDTTSLARVQEQLENATPANARVATGKWLFDVGDFEGAQLALTNVGGGSENDERANILREEIAFARSAKTLYDSAEQLSFQGRPREAAAVYAQANTMQQSLVHPILKTKTLLGLAASKIYLSKLREAEGHIRESELLAQQQGERTLIAHTLLVRGTLYDRRSNYDSAIACLARAESLAAQDGARGYDTRVRAQIGKAYATFKIGAPKEAKASLLSILADSLLSPRLRMTALNRLGVLCVAGGSFQEATEYCKQSLRIAEELGDDFHRALNKDGLSQVSFFTGDYESAVRSLLITTQLYEERGIRSSQVLAQLILTQCYTLMARYDDALRVAEAALAAATATEEPDLKMSSEFVVGQVYHAQHDFARARQWYDLAFTHSREAKYFHVGITAAVSVVNTHYAEGSDIPPSLIARVDSFFLAGEERGYSYLVQHSRNAIAKILIAKKSYPQAIQLLQRIIHHNSALGETSENSSVYESVGDAQMALSQFVAAETSYARAAEVYEERLQRMQAGTNRSAYADEMRLSILEKRLNASYRLGRAEIFFEVAQKTKGNAFFAMLLPTVRLTNDKTDKHILQRADSLIAELAAVSQRKGEEIKTRGTDSRLRSIGKYSERQRDLMNRYSQFLYEQELKNPRLSSIISIPRITAQDIRPLIPKDAILLDYIVLDEKVLVCTLKREGELKVFGMPMTRQKVRDDVATLRIKMSKKFVGETGWKKLAEQFERVLLDSVKASGLLAGINRLIIVPDDVLYYLPFQLLSNGKQSLAERFTIVNYPSAGVMKLMKQLNAQPSARTSMLAMAYSDGSIPFAEAEVKAISADLGAGVTAIVGKSATRDTLRRLAERYDVFHFAMHGVPYPKDPLLGALQFAPTKDDDGKLYVHEVFNLKLKNALVVLNGCETGVDRAYQRGISPGGEVIGLTRAFLYAGASGVVSTLWKVDDKASMEFMRKYYKHLQKTADIADALALAQREFSSDPQYRHPYYWAAYVVTGF